MAQQTFLNVWNALSRQAFSPPASMKAYVFRVAVNVKNDFLRSRCTRPCTAPLLEEHDAIPAKAPDALEKLAIGEAFESLAPAEREVLVLKASGFRSEEIGRLLGISASAARSRLAAAKKRFETALKGCGVVYEA